MTDSGGLNRLVKVIEPDEIYNLAAQSHVHISFDQPEYTADAAGLGTTRLLEAIRTTGLRTRFYQASTSEMFGGSPPPQNEETPFRPRNPYAAAKAYAHWITVNYREAHGMFACCGIAFNHESPRRGGNFVTRKVTRGVAQIVAGKTDQLVLGNLAARRDWASPVGHNREQPKQVGRWCVVDVVLRASCPVMPLSAAPTSWARWLSSSRVSTRGAPESA